MEFKGSMGFIQGSRVDAKFLGFVAWGLYRVLRALRFLGSMQRAGLYRASVRYVGFRVD